MGGFGVGLCFLGGTSVTLTPVLKVALPGKSMTSSNVQDFSLHSSYSSIKIFSKASGTVTINANSNTTVTITHNCGFFPLALLFVELTPGSGRWYVTPFHNITGEDTYVAGDFADTSVDSSTAVFKIYNKVASSKTVSYRYYIIGDSGK